MLSTRIAAGVLGGLIAGLVFGLIMHVALVTTPAGDHVPMMVLVAQTMGATTLGVGWMLHLFNSALFGAIFGVVVGLRTMVSTSAAIGIGAGYGIALWILAGLIVMPLMLGMPVFAPLTMPAMHVIGAISFIGHLVYGVILGVLYPVLAGRLMVSPV
jgi:uncharacterized membrane protein YagU involved in acid resistance